MRNFIFLLIIFSFFINCSGQTPGIPSNGLKIIFIRHGEKPEKGNNLSCKGLNRALQLPGVLVKKFGVPDFAYVPKPGTGVKTIHARMLETIMPLAVKYNLTVNSRFEEKDFEGLAAELRAETGTVLLVWEHSAIPGIVSALGVKDELNWPDDDYDSIWIVTFKKGMPVLTRDKEGLNPVSDCP